MNAHEIPASALLSIQQNMQNCSIIGVSYCVSNHYDAVKLVLTELRKLARQYICFADVNSTVMAKENPAFRDILNEAIFTFPDGESIAKRLRERHYPHAKSVECYKSYSKVTPSAMDESSQRESQWCYNWSWSRL